MTLVESRAGCEVQEVRELSLNLVYLIFFLLCLLMAFPAHAYLDPGTGSMIFQAILAGIVGVGIALKTYWHKFRGLFKKRNNDSEH